MLSLRISHYFVLSLLFGSTLLQINPEAEASSYVPMESSEMPSTQTDQFKNRLKQLEPPLPIHMDELPFQTNLNKLYPKHTVSLSDIIHKGNQIPFNRMTSKPAYIRPVYEPHWHSTYWGGRWSYVPSRIYYASHRLFPTYDIGLSNWMNFEKEMGFQIDMFQNETALDMYLVVFQTEVTAVYTQENQIVIVGNPKRDGVEVITIKTGDLRPENKKDMLLVQLSTDSGHELDYSLINYVPPDFWLQQKAKHSKGLSQKP
ncbi:hypothetical protein [Paenibacillus qinlingensis]|uniref:Uncharacterized protein n=1 Tax=Paenibacillus qinlingensis TaxID=1837343 RepID=A0ABU1NSK5_9BACL|nr:hypothetical protein [Paenibacillus qinlingensis]MDR6549992.1 hypothetical protein [Paenibacillus qinlingensis]